LINTYSIENIFQLKNDSNVVKETGIDNSILDKCAQNDRKAQELVYRKYFDSMIRMCQRYTQDEDELITIVNDGFLKVFKKIDQFERKGSFEGWIRRCVFTSLSDFFRKKKEGIYFMEVPDNKSEVSTALDKMYFEDIVNHIQKLPDNTKNVFIKYCIEGYNHKEIAEIMNMSEGNSKWHLHQAKKMLQNFITQDNDFSKSYKNG
jgi:RNA polymerase sigma-70 factor (ECF subfamily)